MRAGIVALAWWLAWHLRFDQTRPGYYDRYLDPSIVPTTGYVSGSYLLNRGAMVYRTYSVGGGNLQMAELSLSTGTVPAAQDLYPQIVNLQAMYGKDTDVVGQA